MNAKEGFSAMTEALIAEMPPPKLWPQAACAILRKGASSL